MTPHDFVQKWKPVTLTEMSAYQQHFLDLCEMLGEKKPADVDPTGDWFTFQKGVKKANDKKGWADVWRKGCFGWEYKGKHKDLKAAYEQLLQYREALLNPPLLIVCDLDKFEIHTNFLNTVKRVHKFDLDTLGDPKNLALLRNVFTAPHELNPGKTREQVTEEIAGRFAELTNRLQKRKVPPHDAARFLIKLMFCMFAQDIGLLPKAILSEILAKAHSNPSALSKRLRTLFNCMAKGEPFGADDIRWFNGGLFTDCHVIDLTKEEIEELIRCAVFDWAEVEPSIFGTLFERTIDPDKRAQIGAHYTGRKDIETILQTVLLDPLRREWNAVRVKADALWAQLQEANRKATSQKERGPARRARKAFEDCVREFFRRLTEVSILDPACGSGNFLYLSLHMLLDFEKEVWRYGADRGITYIPQVAPDQLNGMEVNTYARELAQVVVWIGYLQWHKFNGFRGPENPVLDAMEAIRRMDAILDMRDPANPKEPEWPVAEFIVGNPPFLGGNKIRNELGDEYVDALFRVYEGRIPGFADLCCYWFEKARHEIETKHAKRAGLLATQGIRGGANRTVLERIKATGDIFFARSDEEWALDGAMVHISMVGFDNGTEKSRLLDGKPVLVINPSLTSGVDIALARRLAESGGRCFMGASKKASFDITETEASAWLNSPNPSGCLNSDVVRPWANGIEVTRRPQHLWIVDFGNQMPQSDAAQYAEPFDYLSRVVRPQRVGRREERLETNWWRFGRPRVEMRGAIAGLSRYLVTPALAKHRTFCWLEDVVVPDQQLLVFANATDYFFGILHSRVHEVWSMRMSTRLEDRPRYTPTTCFETFPFPEPFAALEANIAAAAQNLDSSRRAWLNPPEWTRTEVLQFPGSTSGPWRRYIAEEDIGNGIGTVRYLRQVPKDAECAKKLKQRTLTNLYNELQEGKHSWLKNAHRELDEFVFAAYGWSPSLTDDELLAKLLELNLSRPVAGTPAEAEQEEESASVT